MLVKRTPVFHIIYIMAADIWASVRAQYYHLFAFLNNEMADGPPPWNARSCLSCIVNIMAADDLVIQEARASVAMLLTNFTQNLQFQQQQG